MSVQSVPVVPQDHNLDTKPLITGVQAIEAESGGFICFAARDFSTGRTLTYRPDYRCQTASVIKFPMLVHVAMAVQEGALNWNDKLVLTNQEKVPGSGVLALLTEGLEISLRDVCTLMTVVSDNTGTNMIIDRLGVEPINARMRSLGLPLTTLFRKAYTADTPESAQYGLGMTTPLEMLELLSLVVAAGSEAHSVVLDIMKGQFYRDCIPRFLPEDWSYAGKTGAVDAVRNDVGVVTAPDGRRFALALFCQRLSTVQWTADNPGTVALARLSRLLIVDGFAA